MLKNILISTILGAASITPLSKIDMVLSSKKNSTWTDYDLSKLQFKNAKGKDHSLSSWDSTDISDNDITIPFNSIINNDPVTETIQQQTYICLSQRLDKILENKENDNFHTSNILSDEATNPDFINDLHITILGQSSNSREKLDDEANTFSKVWDMNMSETDSFYLRISNSSSTDWNKNKSYFDASVNIIRTPSITNLSLDAGWFLNESVPAGQYNITTDWTNSPDLIFNWKNYAQTWDDFINTYKYIKIPDIGGSNDFHFYVWGANHSPDSLVIDTKDIAEYNWSDPSATGDSTSFSWSYSKWINAWQGQSASASVRVTHDNEYVYFNSKYHLRTSFCVSGVSLEIDIENINLEMYE